MGNELLQKKISDLESENFILKEKLNRLEISVEQDQTEHDFKRQPRTSLNSDIELASAFDIVEAEGINVSEGGVCFEVARPLLFDMQFEESGEMVSKKAALMWVEKRKSYGFYIGLKFVNDTES